MQEPGLFGRPAAAPRLREGQWGLDAGSDRAYEGVWPETGGHYLGKLRGVDQ